jgi:hypothetical protein
MEQCLQQAESAPIGHAFMVNARWKAVSTPSLSAFLNIWAVASQVVASLMFSAFVSRVFVFSMLSSIQFCSAKGTAATDFLFIAKNWFT